MPDPDFLIIDTETNGMQPPFCGLLELGVVGLKDDEVVLEYSQLVNPGGPIDKAAQKVHGISQAMVRSCPGEFEVVTQLFDLAERTVFVAHNVSFDAGVICGAAWRHDMSVPPWPLLDTISVARAAFPEVKSYSLQSLAPALGIETGKSHRALDDARAAASIFRMARKRLEGVKTTANPFAPRGDLTDYKPGPARPSRKLRPYNAAIEESREMVLRYVTLSGKSRRWRVVPNELFSWNDNNYLGATVSSSGEQRIFRLDRTVVIK